MAKHANRNQATPPIFRSTSRLVTRSAEQAQQVQQAPTLTDFPSRKVHFSLFRIHQKLE
jgi:hypothetical protein